MTTRRRATQQIDSAETEGRQGTNGVTRWSVSKSPYTNVAIGTLGSPPPSDTKTREVEETRVPPRPLLDPDPDTLACLICGGAVTYPLVVWPSYDDVRPPTVFALHLMCLARRYPPMRPPRSGALRP